MQHQYVVEAPAQLDSMTRSRSRSRERCRDSDRDRDRDRRDHGRDRDRDRDRDHSGRLRSSSLERDSGRDREGRRLETGSTDRDRDFDRDRDRERRDDDHRDNRSSRRSRSPDRRQRSRSRSRTRYDSDRDRYDRDRGGYDRSRCRDEDRFDRDRSRDDRDRDRREGRDRYDRRYSRDDDDGYGRRRYSSRMDDLDGGMDGRRSRSVDADDAFDTWRSRRGQPSNLVHVRNIPEDRDESEVRQLFEGFSGLLSVRLVRSRTSGASRGNAFVEFATEADAAVLMETKARHGLQLGGNTLWLEYAHCVPAMLPPAANTLDWICDMCSAVNFARRIECHKCSTTRPSNPQRAAAEAHAPSPILKVSNLEPHLTDDDLRSLFLAHVSVKDVRLVLDKYTGLPRGLAFVEMFSVGEATRALGLLNGVVPSGSSQPLRLCYARDKFGGTGAGPAGTSAGAEALEAAQAMSAYSNWEPKAFDARALDGDAPDGQQEQLNKSQEQEQAGTSGGSAQGQAQGQEQTPAGFVYDPTSGYWYDAASGYYYDANTGLYYHRSTNQWYSYDHATGQYAAVGGGASTSGDVKDASVSTRAAYQPARAGSAKRSSAVIGAAPVLNAQGLLAAAALVEERSKMAQKQQQAKQQGKAQTAVKAIIQQQSSRPQPAGAQAAAVPAQVQGVIHRGKWAQRSQQ
ncbi:hypothetical protein VOLCADRAFT_120369 [Volvox carteri f. nagariensis]|uniref:RNA binding protein n=1 Tax=Volvox carteri f. nagariensis TaxID=3068 RepID=D8TJW8_VOLCA|nr:uncharacterized protein VOLCADRAFT_120369 [Volvox carteri f. nagariensis]EFJ51961.1 hypothetical protein VOLCADRAFT_120369 [Volvox carteri f. nagariensis]|eukprot:XP_002946735.1 hypothetical protein VOLCADRAFT_120369 [Volvox carteri f. nagariensis]